MKKLFAKAFLGLCALGTSTVAFAQDAAPAIEGGMYQAECQTENQSDSDQTHEVGTTFDKLCL